VSENTIRRHTLLLQGVNNELLADEACNKLRSLFNELAKACGVSEKKIEPPLVI